MVHLLRNVAGDHFSAYHVFCSCFGNGSEKAAVRQRNPGLITERACISFWLDGLRSRLRGQRLNYGDIFLSRSSQRDQRIFNLLPHG